MAATLPPPGGSFEPCPAGSHVARCVSVIDLGTQENTYEGKTTLRRQLMITFETPLELMEDQRPFEVSGWYTWSMNEKAKLREHLESWRGKPFTPSDFGPEGFHIAKLLGVPAMITVTEGKEGKTRLTHIAPMPKGMDCPHAVNQTRFLWLDEEDFDPEVFDQLSDNMKSRLQATPEYKGLVTGSPPADKPAEPSDTPF